MIVLLLACWLWPVLIAAMLLRATLQYRHYVALPGPEGDDVDASVSVIVPARNEARSIARCIGSLARQHYPAGKLHLLLVDDASTDRTAALAAEAVAAAGFADFTPLTAPALPAGWLGKPAACWHGARHAGMCDYLCFIDADTCSRPLLLRAAVQYARRHQIDMLSLEPFQELDSFWEKVLIPSGFWLLALTQDLRRVNDPACTDAAANGQCILIRRSVYEAVGGHAAVRSAVAEDTALAALVKGAGYRLLLAGAEEFITTRMFHTLSDIWHGVSRNFVTMVGGARAALLSGLCALSVAAAALALPALAVVYWHARGGVLAGSACFGAAAGTALLAATHVGIARHLKIGAGYGLLFPLGYVVGAALAWDALRRQKAGLIAWKGRPCQQQAEPVPAAAANVRYAAAADAHAGPHAPLEQS